MTDYNKDGAYRATHIQKKKALIEAVYNKIGVRYAFKSLTVKQLKDIINQ